MVSPGPPVQGVSLPRHLLTSLRVRALNMLGESEPSALPALHGVRLQQPSVMRPAAGAPYITFTDAVNETTIMLMDGEWSGVAGSGVDGTKLCAGQKGTAPGGRESPFSLGLS